MFIRSIISTDSATTAFQRHVDKEPVIYLPQTRQHQDSPRHVPTPNTLPPAHAHHTHHPSMTHSHSMLSAKQINEGIKALEQYCQSRYGCGTVVDIEPGTYETLDNGEPASDHGSRAADQTGASPRRQSCRRDAAFSNKPIWALLRKHQTKKQTGLKLLVLVSIVCVYAMLGGLLFLWIESGAQLQRLIATRQRNAEQRQLLIANITQALGVDCDGDCRSWLLQYVAKYDRHTGTFDKEQMPTYSWQNYWTCMFYACTLFTAIGYGNMTCGTVTCKAATIVYSLIGIPGMLVVLHHLGDLVFNAAQHIWSIGVRCSWRLQRSFRKRKLRTPPQQVPVNTSNREGHVADEAADDVDDCESLSQMTDRPFPLWLALLLVIIYTAVCAALFPLFEPDWTFFESFYYFFISISTIGLGDAVPSDPMSANVAFLLFVVGLALVSGCASLVAARIEARYMAAMQIVEQQVLLDTDERHNNISGRSSLAGATLVHNQTLGRRKSHDGEHHEPDVAAHDLLLPSTMIHIQPADTPTPQASSPNEQNSPPRSTHATLTVSRSTGPRQTQKLSPRQNSIDSNNSLAVFSPLHSPASVAVPTSSDASSSGRTKFFSALSRESSQYRIIVGVSPRPSLCVDGSHHHQPAEVKDVPPAVAGLIRAKHFQRTKSRSSVHNHSHKHSHNSQHNIGLTPHSPPELHRRHTHQQLEQTPSQLQPPSATDKTAVRKSSSDQLAP